MLKRLSYCEEEEKANNNDDDEEEDINGNASTAVKK